MTHLPPFRTRQTPPAPTREPDDAFDDDDLPLLGEDAILERGLPSPDMTGPPDALDEVPSTDDDDDIPVLMPEAPSTEDRPAPQPAAIVEPAALAGAWAAQYDAARRPVAPHAEAPPSVNPPEATAEVPAARDARDGRDERDDPVNDSGLSSADEALAAHIAEGVLAALQPSLRDTVLDAVRDALAAARRPD